MTYRMTDALTDALAEIERLQAQVVKLEDFISKSDFLARDHRREQLLREALPWLTDHWSGTAKDLAIDIHAEVNGGKPLSKAERDGIIAEYEAGDL